MMRATGEPRRPALLSGTEAAVPVADSDAVVEVLVLVTTEEEASVVAELSAAEDVAVSLSLAAEEEAAVLVDEAAVLVTETVAEALVAVLAGAELTEAVPEPTRGNWTL